MTRPPLPDKLFHYTTPAGVLGILNSREFWLTNFESLNDSSEVVYGLGKVHERVVAALATEDHPATRSMLELVADQLANPQRTFDRDPQLLGPSSVAVCAFSEAADDLSQWRGYGSRDGGYALSVRPEVLREVAGSQSCFLQACVYTSDDVAALVDPMIESYVDDMRRGTATSVYQNFWTASVAIAAQIKHPAFASEREWRLVRTNMPLEGMVTELLGARLRAVVKVSWEQHRDVVHRVIIGPHQDAALAARALAPAIARAIGSPTMFEFSAVPFRPS